MISQIMDAFQKFTDVAGVEPNTITMTPKNRHWLLSQTPREIATLTIFYGMKVKVDPDIKGDTIYLTHEEG